METWTARCGCGRLHCCLLPGLQSLQLRPATGTGSGHATSGPAPSLEGLCFLWPLEGWLPRAVAALEPPRPLIKGQEGGIRPTCGQGHGEMGTSGVSGSGAAHMNADSPGRADQNYKLSYPSQAFSCCKLGWCLGEGLLCGPGLPEFTAVEDTGDGCLQVFRRMTKDLHT